MKLTAMLLCGLTAWAGADDPVAVLMRLRDTVTAHGERIPNHTCVETIVRDRYDYTADPPKSCDALLGRRKRAGVGTLIRLATTDRVRLDVTLAEAREMYSWAGAPKFDEREIDEFVPAGAIGTGAYAATLLSLFEARNPNFAFEGETTWNGRQALEYSFNVHEEESQYKVKVRGEWQITGNTGTMLLDPTTAELLQLNVRTEELPAASHLCEVDNTLEYSPVKLGGENYLLPKVTHERFIEPNGGEAENTITFSACRDFRGESALHFGEDGQAASGKTPAAKPMELPPGLPVTVNLTSLIQTDKSAAGDRIEGRLVDPIRNALQETFAPAGAKVEGRLMRVEKRYGKDNDVTIALRWETVEVNGVKIPLSLLPDRQLPNRPVPQPGTLRSKALTFDLPRPGEGSYILYRFADHVDVKGDLKSQWLTVKP